jgi:hypothetical protein
MSNALGPQNGPATTTAIATCVYGLTGKVQFTMYISSDDATHSTTHKTFKTTSWAQCLGVQAVDGVNANYILIDTSLNLWLYRIKFDSGSL